jgi:hypothetical protein
MKLHIAIYKKKNIIIIYIIERMGLFNEEARTRR